MITPAEARRFVPREVNPSEFSQLEPLYQQLIDRPLNSLDDFQQWLADVSELYAVVDEHSNRLYIEKSCHTDDEAIQKRFLDFLEHVEPQLKPLAFQLKRHYVNCPYRDELPADRFAVLTRKWTADVELFRPENVAVQTEIAKLANQYDTINGAMTVTFRGEERTLPQMGQFLEDPDRTTREQAWRTIQDRRAADRARIDEIFDQLLAQRQKLAEQTGLANYREYVWRDYHRFDYTPEHCEQFATAIADACVPLVEKLYAKRQQELGVDSLRPWDLEVDPQGHAPLRPFPVEQPEVMVEKTSRMIHKVSPVLGEEFSRLEPGRNLDLASRKGKQPGGYQASLEESRQPFIFMNAAGLQDDVVTLLHEAGHAFHYLAATSEPLMFLRHAPIEFCEVASMSMELLALPYFDELYSDSAEVARAREALLERVIRLLPWIATIDSYQQWLYTNPGHTLDQRRQHWLSLHTRFSGPVDWNGLEAERASFWHKQLHLFDYPFYYVEYGIAQLGALQLWQIARSDPQAAIDGYRRALALGGKRPLPELFAAAGIHFDFSAATLQPLMDAVAAELKL